MAEPLVEFKKTRKTNITFNRHHSDRYHRVKPNWRKPRGIDNRVRRKLRGAVRMPGKRYKNDEVLRHFLPNCFKKVMISNVAELEALQGQNRMYCAEIRHQVGAKKRIEIVNRAKKLDIVVINEKGRLTEENKE